MTGVKAKSTKTIGNVRVSTEVRPRKASAWVRDGNYRVRADNAGTAVVKRGAGLPLVPLAVTLPG